MNIPEYKTVAGLRSHNGAIGKNDLRFCVVNTTVDECREYALQLESLGFVKHTQREIPSVDAEKDANLFYTYYYDDFCLFVFFNSAFQTTFITAEPKQPLPEKPDPGECIGKASFSQLQIASGMCYAVRLCSGRFLCIDGGTYDQTDEERLYAFLRDNSPHGQKPRIALWLFTHSHSDHIQLAAHFIERYAERVEIDGFAYQFCDCDKVSAEIEDMAEMKQDIAAFETAIQNAYPNAAVYTLHTGQCYSFPGVELEILRSLDDTYLYNYFSFNDMSAAFRMTFAGGKTVMILGDTMQYGCRELAQTYGKYLKSDVMQVAHHGLIGGEKGLYQLIDPDICFWPTGRAVFSGHYGGRYQYCLGEGGCDFNAYIRDDSIKKREHYPAAETVTLSL